MHIFAGPDDFWVDSRWLVREKRLNFDFRAIFPLAIDGNGLVSGPGLWIFWLGIDGLEYWLFFLGNRRERISIGPGLVFFLVGNRRTRVRVGFQPENFRIGPGVVISLVGNRRTRVRVGFQPERILYRTRVRNFFWLGINRTSIFIQYHRRQSWHCVSSNEHILFTNLRLWNNFDTSVVDKLSFIFTLLFHMVWS